MRLFVLLFAGVSLALTAEDSGDTDGEQSRKILGSSVVTSVSVIMDTGNGSKAVYTDAVGKPVPKPSTASDLASPIDLLNPDRYEFYTFDDNGDLIKRLMSLEEIQGIIATGDSDGYDLDSFTSLGYLPEKRVNDVVNNVQNVLKEEMETHKTPPNAKPVFDTPDVSDSWSMILPAVFGNSGEDIKPERPIAHVTPDTIMVEPNMQNVYLSTTTQKSNNVITTSPNYVSSASTPRSTSFSHPAVFSTSAQMSTTEKLSTIIPGSTTNKIPSLTPVTETEIKPDINVEIYSNSKSTTEKPLDLLGVDNVPVIEIKPNSTEAPKTSAMPTVTSRIPSTTMKIELPSQSITPTVMEFKTPSVITDNVTKRPATLATFVVSSMGSTLPTTKSPTTPTSQQLNTASISSSTSDLIQTPSTVGIPLLTKQTTANHISTWRPEPFSAAATETQTVTEEAPLSTWIPKVTTTETPQLWIPKLTTTEKPQLSSNDDLPTLAELLNLNKITETTGSEPVTTTAVPEVVETQTPIFLLISSNKNKEETTTTEYTTEETTQAKVVDLKQQSTEIYLQDLTTLGSELTTTKLNESLLSNDESTTQLTLEQSMNNDQKASATNLLGQLLSTTNIYEINTELAEKTTEQQTFSNEDERFETNTQEESKLSEVKTELPTTTEHFLIKVTEQNEESTTDKTLIDSIEQLLSQAVGNVEEVLTTINGTQTVQEMLTNSGNKNMSDIQAESATLASNLIGLNDDLQQEDEKPTTEMSMLEAISSGDSNILSDSVGSLLSQVFDSDRPTATTIVEPLPTEKNPTPTTLSNKLDDNNVVFTTAASERWEAVSVINKDEDSNKVTLIIPETTTTPKEDEMVIETTTTTYTPLNMLNNDNTSKDDFVPHLINITILSPDETITNIRNSSYKPAKVDVSLEQLLDEELKKNMTVTENTEAYIEQTSTSSSNEKIPNEILNAEETMAGLHNSDLTTTTVPIILTTTVLPELQETTELSTEEAVLSTTEYLVPIKEVPVVDKRPTTIVIIKRTEKPAIESFTTASPVENDNGLDTTTLLDEQLLESTTFSKLETDTTQFTTEEVPLSTTELIPEDTKTERIIEEDTDIKPSVLENNKNVTEEVKLEISNDKLDTEKEPENKIQIDKEKLSNKDNKPQLLSNIKISGQSSKKEDSEQLEGKPSEAIIESKPQSTWTLVPTIAPHSEDSVIKNGPPVEQYPEAVDPPAPVDLEAKPLQGFGLEDSTSNLDTDIYQFAQLCNELAFGFWKTVTNGLSSARSVFVSPFGATSLLAMVFLGARGATSGEMNEILRLDDMVTFNPHLIFKNVSESIKTDEADTGVASSAMIRELFSDRSKGKLLPFYKERARAFYDGYVEEVSFREIGDVIRRRTNLQVKKYSNGKISEYLKDSSISARSPLAGVSVNVFQTDCSQASTEGRDGELHFVVLPSIRQRRLIPVPAVVYRSGFLAGYEPSLDATAISLGTKDQIVSTILVIPGQQGISAPGDGLARLEKRLVESSFKKGAWSRLLRSLIPRPGLEVQIPRFSHRSVINATVTLKKMGLHDLFDVEKADLRGLNGVANELFLSDMLQINSFATCGEKRISETHHSEIYPATALRARNSRYLEHFQSEESFWRSDLLEEPRDYQRAFHDPLHDPSFLSLPLPLRPRQARIPETPRLRFDRPFIYFVRHNPTGLILHMGRFNPRLLP